MTVLNVSLELYTHRTITVWLVKNVWKRWKVLDICVKSIFPPGMRWIGSYWPQVQVWAGLGSACFSGPNLVQGCREAEDESQFTEDVPPHVCWMCVASEQKVRRGAAAWTASVKYAGICERSHDTVLGNRMGRLSRLIRREGTREPVISLSLSL